jgi:hypothetical protein
MTTGEGGTRVNQLALFVTATVVGGLGGLVGSILGNAFDALFAGGFIGGVALSPLTAWIGVKRGWINADRFFRVTAGAAIGFLAAATLAINTLSSPVGPVVATTLTGLGALAGARLGAK